jgi:hypothetical protein
MDTLYIISILSIIASTLIGVCQLRRVKSVQCLIDCTRTEQNPDDETETTSPPSDRSIIRRFLSKLTPRTRDRTIRQTTTNVEPSQV